MAIFTNEIIIGLIEDKIFIKLIVLVFTKIIIQNSNTIVITFTFHQLTAENC